MWTPRSGWALALLALLFALLAIESTVKPFIANPEISFVLLGRRTEGLLEAIAARIHALLMLAIAVGIWKQRRFALALLMAYLPYVLLNRTLFFVRAGEEPAVALASPLFEALFTAGALGVPAVSLLLLWRRRAELS
jgi:hypothetical protein